MTSSHLVGRDDACARVSEFVAHSAVDGGALLIVGDPGIGKSVLLQVASDLADDRGTSVLRAEGVGFKADVSHAVLDQLLVPLADLFPRLSALHGRALTVALGLEDGPHP